MEEEDWGDSDGPSRPCLRGGESGPYLGPQALAVVPGLGLLVRGTRVLQLYAHPDALAMAAMSPGRVAWMGAVARAQLAMQPQPNDSDAWPGSPGRTGVQRARRV